MEHDEYNTDEDQFEEVITLCCESADVEYAYVERVHNETLTDGMLLKSLCERPRLVTKQTTPSASHTTSKSG